VFFLALALLAMEEIFRLRMGLDLFIMVSYCWLLQCQHLGVAVVFVELTILWMRVIVTVMEKWFRRHYHPMWMFMVARQDLKLLPVLPLVLR
jgi:hypothetical protein